MILQAYVVRRRKDEGDMVNARTRILESAHRGAGSPLGGDTVPLYNPQKAVRAV